MTEVRPITPEQAIQRVLADQAEVLIAMNLPSIDIDLFYKLHGSLLAYANRELKILPQGVVREQVRKQLIQQVADLRDACYARPEILDQYLAANPDRLPPDELAIVASWRHRITGEFYIVRYLKTYTVFMSAAKPAHLYGVLGLIDPLEVVMGGAPVPIMVKATLLPFRDRITYDGILNPYSIFFGPGIRSSVNQTYSRLKEREGIIEGLIGPDGQPQIGTSLARKAPAKAAPDWRPAVGDIVAQTEKMRQTDTRLQGAAFGLLRAAASLAQASLLERGAEDEAARRLKPVRTAMAKIEKLLVEEEW